MRLHPLDPNKQQNYAISNIQDGGGGHLENSKNRNISAKERPILTKCDAVDTVSK